MKRTAVICTIAVALIAAWTVAVVATPPGTTEHLAKPPKAAKAPVTAETITDASHPVLLPGQTYYELVYPSLATWGCWDPCKCPLHLTGDMVGGFVMGLTAESDELTEYDVLNVSWDVYDPFDDDAYVYSVTGAGTYQIFTPAEGDPTHRLTLDLEYGGYADIFDSGEVPFVDGDEFRFWVANHDFYCLNDAFLIQAVPAAPIAQPVGAGGKSMLADVRQEAPPPTSSRRK